MKLTNFFCGMLALVALALPAAGRAQGMSAGVGATATPASGAPVDLSPPAAEVMRMAQSGLTDDVLLAYVSNSHTAFNLSADGVVYLRDLGISSPVLTAMLGHDSTLPAQAGQPVAPAGVYDQHLYASNGIPTAAMTQPTPIPQTATVPPTESAPPPSYVGNPPQDVGFFYDDLSPYGSWVDLPGYGWCWQPSAVVVNPGWRPYCDNGHWIYSDAGWYWSSDYSWGWAPFHYGRWYHHERCGWVWFPDTVWAPAWVTWRISGDHCGWAPLPLHTTFDLHSGFHHNGVSVGVNFDFGLPASAFTFVAVSDFNQHDLRRHSLPPAQVTRVFNNTTIVNNYTVEKNTVIVNKGIPVDRVAAATHTQIKPIAIHDVPAGSRVALEANNRPGTAVVRQELHTRVKTTPIVAQHLDAQHPVVHHPVVTASTTVPATTTTRTQTMPPGQARKNEVSTATEPQGRGTPDNRGHSQSQYVAPAPVPQTAPGQPNPAPAHVTTATSPAPHPSTAPVAPVQPNPARAHVTTATSPPSHPPTAPAAPHNPIPTVLPASSPSTHGQNSPFYSPKGASSGSAYSAPHGPSQPTAVYPSAPPSQYQSSAQPSDNRNYSPKSRGNGHQ